MNSDNVPTCCCSSKYPCCSYRKEHFNIPLIVLGVLFGILLVVFIVLLSLPQEVSAKTTLYIAPGQQTIIKRKATEKNKQKIETDSSDIVTYAFTESNFGHVSKAREEKSFHHDKRTVFEYNITLLPIFAILDYPSEETLKYEYEMSHYACVFLVSNKNLHQFMKNPDGYMALSCGKTVSGTTKIAQDYDSSSYNGYLAVFNPNPFPITVTESVSYHTTKLSLDPEKKSNLDFSEVYHGSCTPAEKGENSGFLSVLVIENRGQGEAQSVNISEYSNYLKREREENLTNDFVPTLSGIFFVFVVLLMFWFYSLPCAQKKRATGTAPSFCGCCSSPCTPGNFTIPIIVLVAITVIFGIVYGILFATVPKKSGKAISLCELVGNNYQTVCNPELSSSNDVHFQCDNSGVVAYQYYPEAFYRLPNVVSLIQKQHSETLKPFNFYVLANTTLYSSTSSPAKIEYTVEVSDHEKATVALLTGDPRSFHSILENKIKKEASCSSDCRQIANSSSVQNTYFLEYPRSQLLALVIYNHNDHPIRYQSAATITTSFRLMDPSKAVKTCTGECTFSDGEKSLIAFGYTGEESDIPISVLQNYKTHDNQALYITMPIALGLFFVPAIVLFTLQISIRIYGVVNAPSNVEMKQSQQSSFVGNGEMSPVSPTSPSYPDAVMYPGQNPSYGV